MHIQNATTRNFERQTEGNFKVIVRKIFSEIGRRLNWVRTYVTLWWSLGFGCAANLVESIQRKAQLKGYVSQFADICVEFVDFIY